MRLPLGKLPRVIGVFNPLRKNPLTNPLIEWKNNVGHSYLRMPDRLFHFRIGQSSEADIVVIHQPQGYNLSLLRHAILSLLKEGTHVLLSGKATKQSLMALPVDIPIAACDNCEFPDDDGNACQRNALERIEILRNLSRNLSSKP